MTGTRHTGFTIIEVTLFLGISGALFLIALIGTGSTIRSIRFTDSGRSLTAFVQQQYDALINGVNTRPSTISCTGGTVTNNNQTPGTSNCLLMGKLLVVTNNSGTITSYDIIGSEPASVDYGQSDDTLIKLFQPRVQTLAGSSEYDIPWGASISGQKRATDNKATNAIALIRSPRSTRIVQYSFKTAENDISTLPTVVNSSAVTMGKNVSWCVASADKLGTEAKLTLNDAPNQSAVQIEFDQPVGSCNGI